MIRTFIAIELAEQVRQKIDRETEGLRRAAPLVKWSHKDNLHVTLRFLGNVKENDLEELFDAVEEAVEKVEPFTVALRGVGAFPNWRYPRVVWAGIKDGAEETIELAGYVEEGCVEIGYEREKRAFRPHLTLGRVKEPGHGHGLNEAAGILGEASFGIVDVDEVVVFMSSLRRTGPVYSPMARFPLLG